MRQSVEVHVYLLEVLQDELVKAPEYRDVWPIDRFKMAFDTDFFALLFHLRMMDNSQDEEQLAKQQFQHFIHTCWSNSEPGYRAESTSQKLISIR